MWNREKTYLRSCDMVVRYRSGASFQLHCSGLNWKRNLDSNTSCKRCYDYPSNSSSIKQKSLWEICGGHSMDGNILLNVCDSALSLTASTSKTSQLNSIAFGILRSGNKSNKTLAVSLRSSTDSRLSPCNRERIKIKNIILLWVSYWSNELS